VRGALLVTNEDVPDRKVEHRVIGWQDRSAGIAEHGAHPLAATRHFPDDLCAGPWIRGRNDEGTLDDSRRSERGSTQDDYDDQVAPAEETVSAHLAPPAEVPCGQQLRSSIDTSAVSCAVPAGTALPLELQTALSSENAAVEMPVRARLTQAISVDGVTVLPSGTQLNGEIIEVIQPGRVKGLARVSFRFTEAVIAGARESIATDPVTFEANPTKGEDATKIGVGAGVGAAIGGILGGGSGAAKGAAIGGAAGTGAVLATRGQHVEVAEGAAIAATLAEPFNLRVRVQ
jgi:hypothetical protein